MILNQAQATAVANAISHLNNISAKVRRIDVAGGIYITQGKGGMRVSIYDPLDRNKSLTEKYKDQNEMFIAYGLN